MAETQFQKTSLPIEPCPSSSQSGPVYSGHGESNSTLTTTTRPLPVCLTLQPTSPGI